jgi:hypothetical protein
MAGTKNSKATLTAIEPVSNDAATQIGFIEPYVAAITITGTSPILFHRWSVEGVAEKAAAAKGSKAKKSDDLESYVYRNDKRELCLPGEYLRMSIIGAAKFKQDPRSPRKSAQDLFKAGIIALDTLVSLGVKDWHYIDKRRVQVQRNAITRQRPALNEGWTASFLMQVLVPEYVSPNLLNEVVQSAGRLIGVADFRPTFGRFVVTDFKVS